MEKYLKMSDYFSGAVSDSLGHVAASYGLGVEKVIFMGKHATAAAHAINSHDELVAMNNDLLAALEEISRLPSYRQDECSEMAREAIAKAKGGAA